MSALVVTIVVCASGDTFVKKLVHTQYFVLAVPVPVVVRNNDYRNRSIISSILTQIRSVDATAQLLSMSRSGTLPVLKTSHMRVPE